MYRTATLGPSGHPQDLPARLQEPDRQGQGQEGGAAGDAVRESRLGTSLKIDIKTSDPIGPLNCSFPTFKET